MVVHESQEQDGAGNVLNDPELVASVADRGERGEDEPEERHVGSDTGPVVKVAHEAPSVGSGSKGVPVSKRLENERHSMNSRKEDCGLASMLAKLEF